MRISDWSSDVCSSDLQFWLGDGDDIIDLTAHGAGGIDYAKDVLVQAGLGNDIVIGGAGKDNLQGDGGNDIIFGWRGSDTIAGEIGRESWWESVCTYV